MTIGTETLGGVVATRAADVEWRDLNNRGGRYRMKEMGVGEDGQTLGFRCVLGDLFPDFNSPRHHHTFDQVRFNLSGTERLGDHVETAGDLSYFPESVFYGPLSIVGQENLVQVTVQIPGPSRTPYPSPDQQYEASVELAKHGEFKDGNYVRDGETVDGFEAIYRQVTGRPARFADPRMDDHIVFRTPNIPWLPFRPGVEIKHVAYLNEVGPNMKMLRLAPGATLAAGPDKPWHEFRLLVSGGVRYGEEVYESVSSFIAGPTVRYDDLVARESGAVILLLQFRADGEDAVPFCAL